MIADLRQPAEATLLSATTGGGGGEGEQLSNLSFLELRSDPDTLLRSHTTIMYYNTCGILTFLWV